MKAVVQRVASAAVHVVDDADDHAEHDHNHTVANHDQNVVDRNHTAGNRNPTAGKRNPAAGEHENTARRPEGREVARIDRGLLVLVGVERGDGPDDVQYIAGKVRDLRVFEDPADSSKHLNRSVQEVGGAVLVVSQFTLAGDCRKGRRPAFDRAAPPKVARPLYEDVVREIGSTGVPVETGEFQAMMRVSLVNDGPVTLLLDSRKTF